jgi:adenosine deaminase
VDIDEVLRRIPKTELHLHLEGAVAAETLADLARKHGVELPQHDDPADLYQYDSLADFLLIYAKVSHSIRDQDDFRRVTYECLARCARDGARYVELFFSPESHLEIGIEYPTMLEGVTQGLKDAQDDLGIRSHLVPAINRELGPARAVEFVKMVVEHRRPEVIGVAMDFNEVGFPPEDYVEAFQYAANHGLHRTSHQGEVGPAANVRNAIELLGCERVDHGYAVIEDADLLRACADSQIVFTVCPTTTTYTTPWRDLSSADHAIRVMADAGLKMMINSDDPPMLSTDLANEYRILHNVMGFSLAEIKEFALNGIDATWLYDATKQEWRREWAAEIDALVAQV